MPKATPRKVSQEELDKMDSLDKAVALKEMRGQRIRLLRSMPQEDRDNWRAYLDQSLLEGKAHPRLPAVPVEMARRLQMS